jgi:hypothetical protein
MRTFWKFAVLAAGMILLLGTIHWVRSEADTQKTDWLYTVQIDWVGLVDQVVTGSAVAALLVWGKRQRGWMLGVTLAVGLVVTGLVGMATFTAVSDIELDAVLLAFCLSLGLVVVLAGMRRWKLLWLGIAAFMGALPQVIELLSAALSFAHQ